MNNINLELKYTNVKENELENYKEKVKEIHKELHSKAPLQNEFVGWLTYPSHITKEEIDKIKQAAKTIQSNSKYLIVIGIGGSYLGAKAVIEALSPFNHSTQILYVGNNLSTDYIQNIINKVKDADYSINVISKSGTTTEPAIAFRIFRKMIIEKYGKSASKRIYVTTSNKGALYELANKENYTTFIIPDNIGGRYSVLTPVGLLPIASSGINIDNLLQGATQGEEKYNNPNLLTNDCYKYACIRNILYKTNKNIEALVTYEPRLHSLIEWWKQLFGESEGKNGKGIFPVGLEFTTDLHSLGQYIQDGERKIFETIINIETVKNEITIEKEENNLDNLNYLQGLTLNYVNHKAMEATVQAHISNDVPNLLLNINKLDENSLGQLIYFFELSCAMSGCLLGVNPFNQPGVEKYKTNMFKLLNKPGY